MTLEEIRSKALEMAEPQFKKFEPIALANTKKVLEAFKECQVSDYHFTGTTGYGYNDVGREKLDEVFAYVFKGEKALESIKKGARAPTFCIGYSRISHYTDGYYGKWL